jgi:hypothetical protein
VALPLGIALAAVLLVVAWPVLRPLTRRWGVRSEELDRSWPGDELILEPTAVTMRAVFIAAPPSLVWPWIAQMGQGRGGLYSYDWAENLLGLDIHSIGEVRQDLQDLRAGDVVRMVPDGWRGTDTTKVPANTVVEIAPGHHVVLRQIIPATGEPPAAYDGTWSFIIEPDGVSGSRLIARGRNRARTHGGAVQWLLQEPIHFLMERKMLRGIKRRAEGLAMVTDGAASRWSELLVHD